MNPQRRNGQVVGAGLGCFKQPGPIGRHYDDEVAGADPRPRSPEPKYAAVCALVHSIQEETSHSVFADRVIPLLVDTWLDEYERATEKTEVVQTTVDDFTYLFDITNERLIAAWGISRGRHSGTRDKSRMAGHPLSAGKLYHRGHAIAHSLGGGTDINLVPQRGSVNVGTFRILERQAVKTPGALYFSYWIYGAAGAQTPKTVEQGLLFPGRTPDIRKYDD